MASDYRGLISNPSGILVGEIDILDATLLDLKPSREQCVHNQKYDRLARRINEEVTRFHQSMEGKSEDIIRGRSNHVARPFLGDYINEESERIQSLLRAWHLHGGEIYIEAVLSNILLRQRNPCAARVTFKQVIECAQNLKISTIFYYTESTEEPDEALDFAGLDMYCLRSDLYRVVDHAAPSRRIVLALREDSDRYSIAPLLRARLKHLGFALVEVHQDFDSISTLVSAKQIDVKLPAKLALVEAEGEQQVYSHPEGAWINSRLIHPNRLKALVDYDGTTVVYFLLKSLQFEALDQLFATWLDL